MALLCLDNEFGQAGIGLLGPGPVVRCPDRIEDRAPPTDHRVRARRHAPDR